MAVTESLNYILARKPEKLETFNEGKFEYPTKFAGEADVLEAADRNPQLIPGTSLKPGHRFFILNGEDLFTNFPLPNNREINLKYAQNQPEQIQLPLYPQSQNIDKQSEIEVNNIPIQTLLLRNAVTGQISNVRDLDSEAKVPENFVTLNQPSADPALFRSGFPINIDSENIQPIGQFRYTAPSEPYFSFDGDDFENDAIIIDAKTDGADILKDEDKNNEGKCKEKTPL